VGVGQWGGFLQTWLLFLGRRRTNSIKTLTGDRRRGASLIGFSRGRSGLERKKDRGKPGAL